MPRQSVIAVTENNRRFAVTVNKGTHVSWQKIDGTGSILDTSSSTKTYPVSGPLCDYCIMVYPNDKRYFFLVELKGTDVMHGVRQLENTIRQIKTIYKHYPKREAYIIAKGFPGPILTRFQNKRQEFKMLFGFGLFAHTGKYKKTLNC